MKSIKYIVLLLLIVIIGFSIYIAVQPNSFEVTRTKTINAPQSVVYDNIIDFKNWESWSYLVEAELETVISLSEKTKGIGGSFAWENDDGIGTITTINTKLNESITQKMQFSDMPESDVTWDLKPNNDGTTAVTCTISSKNLPFKFKILSALMGGMEQQIGPHFENDLVKLDSVVQAKMKVYSINVKGKTQHSGGYYLYKTASCKLNEFEKNKNQMLPEVGAYALTQNITIAGPPFILYLKWDEENDAAIFSTCIPTNSKIISDESDILTGKLESFRAVKIVLKGDHKNMKEAWDLGMKYIADNDLEIVEGGAMLETYVNDAMRHPNPADWLTEIYVAIK
ncbi:SRPBCC family protein [Winogradskyella sp. UBA3174]|uniref:SRPBCC family protein n=1 Tax=Winogradskyella sp. UBA3174 TaxID=1947785 RepID=UPI0025EE1724|nr:SRPBCC family protein [Winogradskyella sp. UBA3174]|tara:strand:+ start:92985 stop:94004 length:1020 start_codon:yes stop_codon:yes gene_type:complete